MRKLSHEEKHKAIWKTAFLAATVLIYTLYSIYTYNHAKGRSQIYEPVYISLEGIFPESVILELSYQTFNDPTKFKKVNPSAIDSIPFRTYIFKIDSTFLLKDFSIYFRSFGQQEKIIIYSIIASSQDHAEYSFSLKKKDLIPAENLMVEELGKDGIRIEKVPSDRTIVPFLHFYATNLNEDVLKKTGARVSVPPSLLSLALLSMLGACLYLCLHPLLAGLNWSGISLGTYLLASGILILPSGEKVVNLILALALVSGLIRKFREGSIRDWINENQTLLLVIISLVIIYLIAFLSDSGDPATHELLKIKYGLPIMLLAVAFNTNFRRDIRIHYAALLSGVLISVFMHLAWFVLLVDSVELKSRIVSNPRYFMESAVYSMIHHSYLSILYLVSLASMYLRKDVMVLRKYEVFIFSLLIFIGLAFAFSRSSLLSLLLILLYFAFRWFFEQLKIEISHRSRFSAAVALSAGLFILVFADLKIDPAAENAAVRGLSTRAEIWENAGDLIKQKPLTGRGPGDYKIALTESNSSSSINMNRWPRLNTHNQFLETAGMFGLPVALGLIWFLVFPTGISRNSVRFSDFIITTAIIFGTAFFFESILNRNLGVLAFGLCYGLLIKTRTIHGR